MVVHQTVGVYPAAELFLEIDQVLSVIAEGLIRGEHSLAVVTALDDVVGRIGKDDAWLSGHVWTISYPFAAGNK